MELTAANRDRALAASNTVATAQSLETIYHYTADGVAEEWRLGPTHKMTVSAVGEVDGRTKTTTVYDYDKPDTIVYHLPTSVSVAADYTDSGGNDHLVTISQTDYRYDSPWSSAHPNRGWEVRKPTKVIVDPNGKALTTTTIYHDTAPVVLEVRLPGYTTATGGHLKRYTYYGINAGSPWSMGLLASKTTSVAAPEAPMPYHQWSYTRDFNVGGHSDWVPYGGGSILRGESHTYDAAGRLSTTQRVLSHPALGVTTEPLLTTSYDTQGNVSSVTSTPVGSGSPDKTILSTYDNNGRLSTYKDSGTLATTNIYNIDGDLQYVSDPHGGATYTYNERRLPKFKVEGGSIIATYDNDDQLTSQSALGAIKNFTRDPAGNITDLTHVKAPARVTAP